MDLTIHPLIEQRAEVRFADISLSTGVRMHYAEFGDPAGIPIVFLHGTSDSWYSFSRVLDYLPAHYHVYMLDQRGHGNSSSPQTGYAMADFADDAIAFIEAMDLQQVTLIGHSMGSIIAQQVAVKAIDRVARLVLIASTTNPYTDDLREFLTAVNTLEDPVPQAFVRAFQLSTIYGPLLTEFINRVVAESMKLSARVWQLTASGMLARDAVAPLEQIQAPTLILRGEKDSIWSFAEQESLVARIPDAKLRVYPQTGHALHWERPEQFVYDLTAFMASTN